MSDEDKSDADGPETLEIEPNAEDNAYNYNPVQPEEKVNDDVINEDVHPSEAFAKFVQTYHDTSNSDFTGKIRRTSLPKTVTCFQQRSSCEAPLETYQRLVQELKEFKEELASLENVEGVSNLATALKKNISSLQSSLTPLKLSRKYAPFLIANYPSKEDDLHSKNVTQELKSKIKKFQNSKESKGQEEVKGVRYEFYQDKPGKSKSATSIASLEKRLASLEATIGTSKRTIFPDIRSTIIYVGKKMEGLNEKQLKDLETKMSYLGRELKNLEKAKVKISASKKSDYQKKIRELYGMMGCWDQASHTLPIVHQRLQSIKALVTAGKNSKKQLKAVVDDKNEISILLDKGQGNLKKVRGQFGKTMREVKSVCELESTFEDLTKKMQKHFE